MSYLHQYKIVTTLSVLFGQSYVSLCSWTSLLFLLSWVWLWLASYPPKVLNTCQHNVREFFFLLLLFLFLFVCFNYKEWSLALLADADSLQSHIHSISNLILVAWDLNTLRVLDLSSNAWFVQTFGINSLCRTKIMPAIRAPPTSLASCCISI